MEKSSAAKIVSQTFQNPFDKDSFVYFIKSLLNHIEPALFVYRGNFIPDAYELYIKTLERIGKYQDKDDKKIDLLIVHLKKEKSLERARTMQRNFIAWYLNGSRGDIMKDAALVAFVSPNSEDWRFSLVKMDYRLDASGKKVKVKQELTPARRFSFLVGKTESSHTAQSRLAPILQDDDSDPTLKDLEDAFSIEKVTKEFFEKYRDLFYEAKKSLDEIVRKDKKIKQDFKEKNVDTVDFAKKLLGQIVFLYFLQKKGWFGVERDADWGTGPKDFLRKLFNKEYGNYQNFFNDISEPLFYNTLAIERTDDYSDRFNCKIPFLNGGLFDPINNYDWVHTDILLPNKLFSNSEKTKQGDIGTGILDIFDRYNFTVKEDEPLEKEVAVDPEMLGKVFENLLEVKDRKSKGTYYTPREIVHYMCQQSLINYLKTETKIEEEKIERIVKQDVLLTKDEYLKWKKEKQKPKNKALVLWEGEWEILDKALENIRIVDPACGSGAFLVGMLQEIVKARKLLQLFNNQKESIYIIKEKSIKNSIYGVDIDPGAIEIAKLRLWLSLIVEEEDIKQIRPLPNLDYKILCGNSLLGVEKNLLNFPLFDKLEKLKPLFFNETNNKKKQEYKNQIDELISKITNGHKDFNFEIYFSEVFHEKKGFDVVIANPPYDVYEGPRKKEIEVINNFIIYDKAKGGKLNAYKLFLAKSIELQKPNGLLCEIFQNAFLADNSATNIRKHFLINQRIIQIDSFPERDDIKRRVFENVKMSVCILLSQNKNVGEYTFGLNIWKDKYMILSRQITLNSKDVINFDPVHFTIPSISQNEISLLKKISNSPRLKEIASCYEGEINLTFHKKFLSTKKVGRSKMIKGAAVQKWFIKEKMSQGKIEYLDKESYLKENRGNKSLHHKQKRIVMQGITGVDERLRIKATIIEPNIFCGNSTNYVLLSNKDISQEYILALLNSLLLNWYFKIFSTNSNVNTYEVNNFPIQKISLKKQGQSIKIVNRIIAVTKDKDYLQNKAKQKKVKEYERQINQLVYKLYGLIPEEIKIIEDFLIN